jgi:hypothetical protein
MHENLQQLQTLLHQLIAAPQAAERISEGCGQASEGLEMLIRADRINVYVNAYFYRLLECLCEEFPATLAVVGSDDFSALIRGYLLVWPPTEPSIFYAGQYLPVFICNHSLAGRWPFISDLAKLERTILEVFHAADAPALSDECMRAIPPQQWSSIKLETHPAVQILHNKWRVTDILNAVESGTGWDNPEHQRTTVLVWRQRAQVNYRVVDEVEGAALELMSRRASFADICEVIRGRAERLDQVALIGQLLARWLNDGVILGTPRSQTSAKTGRSLS